MGWGGGGHGGGNDHLVQQLLMKLGMGGGKGKGKGGFKASDRNIWIGGLPDSCTFKELFELLKPHGAKWVDVFPKKGKGTAGATFSSAEQAAAAIANFNGYVLNGSMLQVDKWVKA